MEAVTAGAGAEVDPGWIVNACTNGVAARSGSIRPRLAFQGGAVLVVRLLLCPPSSPLSLSRVLATSL